MDEKSILELTYFHTMTVKRKTKYVVDGETKFSDVDVYTNVKCAASKNKNGGYNTKQSDAPNNINYSLTLFCSPQYSLLTGDRVFVTYENGLTKEYRSGEGFYYTSHAEIPLLREVEA